MKKQGKSLRRIGAWALAAAMLLTGWGFMTPSRAEIARAAETVVTGVNYAPAGTATVSNQETDYWGADKAIDGIVNRDAEKADQSRWATKQDVDSPTLTVDLGTERTFNRFVIEWERTNVTGFKIEKSTNGTDEWTSVYTKSDEDYVSSTTEIKLDGTETARYLRLVVTDYTGRSPDDDIDWRSLSIYEFKIIADVDVAGEDIVKNLSLDATASADSEEAETVAVEYANDGNQSTHWGSAVGEASVENPHWVQLTWDDPQVVQTIKIHWERHNATEYSLQTSENGSEWRDIQSFTEAPADYWQIIELDEPLTTKYLRINITAFNPTGAPEGGNSVTYATVGVCEFETYSYAGILETEEELTLQDVADSLEAPEVNADGTAVTLPTVEGYKVELLADYEQVVERDGSINKPLTGKTVKAIYKVTQGEGEDAESAEGTKEYTLEIPGKYAGQGTNKKPAVIPELAEWYGGEEAENFTVGSRILVSAKAKDLMDAAKALKDDYNTEMNASLTVETGDDPQAGDIYFVKDDGSNGLGEEGYVMDIDEYVTVSADHNTGAYWATRSILQITELNDGKMPKGIAKDYPKYEVRGFMLDVARKPISMETLQDIAKEMAYYKMNEFHLHLNDNLIFYEDYASAEEARELAYTGFRLESDVLERSNDGLNQADLTNKDLYYTKKDFRNFILDCRSMGVNITPEFDTPGHSGAFTKVRPDLMLQNIVSGAANRAGEQFDLSPEKYDQSLAFVKSIWDEYLNEGMFDQSMTVHIGTDEYYGEKNRFRMFSDDLIEYIQSKGYTVRLWGSLSSMPGEADVRSEGVQMNVWNTIWAKPTDMYNEGFELINTIDGSLYIVPAAGYYYDYLNTQNLYNNWVPNKFDGTVIPAGSDQMLGSTYAIWNDSVDTRANGISEIDIYDRFADAVPTMASKNWGEAKDLTYSEMESVVDELGDAANSNPYHEASADDNGEYMSYEFDDTSDSSKNGRNLSEPVNAEITDGSLKLNGGESYVTTPIDKLATGNTLEFDITLETPAQAGDILFEADNEGSNGDYVHDIRIMDDGRLGFRRELYDYYSDYKLPVGEKVHLSISTNGTTTTLTVNGATYEAVGLYRNRQTDNTVRKENISNATLLLPLQRIGSKTNAIAAEIDNVNVTVAQESGAEYNKAGWTGTASSEYIGNPSSTEGEIEKAFDNNSGTIWHSNYTGDNSMKLVCAEGGTLETVSAEIDLGETYTINQFSFTPRTGTNSGQVTKADLYIKANEGDDWIKVAEDAEFADDATTKTFYFDEQEVQYVWFVAKESDDGWVAVSEFDIANVPEQTYTVYVDAQDGGSASGGATELAANTEVTVTAKADKGYTFAGWYDAVTETKVSDKAEYTFKVTENTALRAYFTKNNDPEETHTVTLIVGDNETTQTVKDGDTAEKPKDPVKEGYKFIGWYVDDKEYDFSASVMSDLVIEARFEKIDTPVDPGKPGTDTPDSDNGKTDKEDGKAVQTGDQSSPVVWVVVLVAACAAAGAVVVIRKKIKRNNRTS